MTADLVGSVFGRLTVVSAQGRNADGRWLWACRCECGSTKNVAGRRLTGGLTKSCGCLHREVARATQLRHGGVGTLAYRRWAHIIQRCLNPNDSNFHHYGGRGITVCERWLDFANFLTDMGQPPEGMTIERENNDGPYSPENCVWATRQTQMRNRRVTRWLEWNGDKRTVSEWADHIGMARKTLRGRLKRGWEVERALSEKPREMNRG